MFFLITDPFFVSTNALSLQCLDLLLVCLMSSLFRICATKWLMNSLPRSEWKLKMVNGYWDSISSSAGPNVDSAMVGTHTTTSHCVISSTEFMWYTSLWWTVSTRIEPGRLLVSGGFVAPMAISLGLVAFTQEFTYTGW